MVKTFFENSSEENGDEGFSDFVTKNSFFFNIKCALY